MISRQFEASHFGRLATYLMRSGRDREVVEWAVTRNLPTEEPELAAVLMQATANANVRVQRAVYQFVVEFPAEDRVDRALMERAADGLLAGVGLGEHQVLIVAHGSEPNPHLHIMVNRVHPETGRCWSTWRAWTRTREVLCQLERDLGLHRFSPRLHGVYAVAQELRSYERVLALAEERYRAELDAEAAKSRWAHVQLLGEQAQAAQKACKCAFARVFTNSEEAFATLVRAAREEGIPQARARLRDHPEQFGALHSVERTRVFGLKRTLDDSDPRARVPAAAVAAQEVLSAARAWQRAADRAATELEHAFEAQLRVLYREPREARALFERLASEHGIERAGAIVREHSGELGALRTPAQEPEGRLSERVALVAMWGMDAWQARAAARAGVPCDIAAPRSVARAAEHADAIRREVRSLPTREALEARLGGTLKSLSTLDWNLLRLALTGPQYAMAMRLRRAVREIALGRDDDGG